MPTVAGFAIRAATGRAAVSRPGTWRLAPSALGGGRRLGAATSLSAADPVPPPPVPAIHYLMPVGGQRGTAPEVVLQGVNLAGVSGLRFSNPQLAVQVIENPDPAKVKIKVTIPGDAARRTGTARGDARRRVEFSPVRGGEFAEVTEAEPNSEIAQAMKLESLPVVVNGQVLGEDQDLVRFAAKAGQSFVFPSSRAASATVLPGRRASRLVRSVFDVV